MRRLLLPIVLGIVLHAAAGFAAEARDGWRPGAYTLDEALEAGFTVVDVYHNNEGRLFFVLQRQAVLLLCIFEEVQMDRCLQLGGN